MNSRRFVTPRWGEKIEMQTVEKESNDELVRHSQDHRNCNIREKPFFLGFAVFHVLMPCLASISVFLRDRLINYVLKFYANCKQFSEDLRLTHFQIPRKGYDEANSFRDGSDSALKEGLWKKV